MKPVDRVRLCFVISPSVSVRSSINDCCSVALIASVIRQTEQSAQKTEGRIRRRARVGHGWPDEGVVSDADTQNISSGLWYLRTAFILLYGLV